MYQNILVPLDGSELGEAALATAVDVARCTGAILTLIRVPDHPMMEYYIDQPVVLADLRSADLSYAILAGADLSGANLKGAILESALYDRETIWPEGFEPEQAGAMSVGKPVRPWWKFWSAN